MHLVLIYTLTFDLCFFAMSHAELKKTLLHKFNGDCVVLNDLCSYNIILIITLTHNCTSEDTIWLKTRLLIVQIDYCYIMTHLNDRISDDFNKILFCVIYFIGSYCFIWSQSLCDSETVLCLYNTCTGAFHLSPVDL